jgi:hypothetical protein
MSTLGMKIYLPWHISQKKKKNPNGRMIQVMLPMKVKIVKA